MCDRVGFIKKGELMTVQRLDGTGSVAGKKVCIVVREDTKSVVERLKILSDVKNIVTEGDTIRFFFTGDVTDLIGWAGTMALSDFICEPPSVEDYFISLYGE